jgi:hypothetical protein
MGFSSYLANGVTTLTFVATAVGGNHASQIVVPATAQAGDLAILYDAGWSGSVSVATPSGWTQISDSIYGGLGNSSCRISRKVLVSGDISATVTGITATRTRQMMVVYRPNDTIDTVSVTTPNTFVSDSADPSAQSVVASAEPTPGVVIGAWFCTNPDLLNLASTPTFDGIEALTLSGVSSGGSMQLGYKRYNASPADHSISSSGTGSRHLQSFYIRVS